MDGVEEQRAALESPASLSGGKAWRRMGDIGPVYEVLSVTGEVARIRLLHPEIELEYPMSDVEADALA